MGKKGKKNWRIVCQTDQGDEFADDIEGKKLLLASVEAVKALGETEAEPEEATQKLRKVPSNPLQNGNSPEQRREPLEQLVDAEKREGFALLGGYDFWN